MKLFYVFCFAFVFVTVLITVWRIFLYKDCVRYGLLMPSGGSCLSPFINDLKFTRIVVMNKLPDNVPSRVCWSMRMYRVVSFLNMILFAGLVVAWWFTI